MRAAACLVALVLAAAAAAGCGGDDKKDGTTGSSPAANGEQGPAGAGSTRDRIKQTVGEYVSGLNASDAKRVCAVLNKNGEGVLAGILPSDQGDTGCEQVAQRVAARWTDLPRYRVSGIKTSGSRATARLSSRKPQYASDVLLQLEGGGWKVAYPPAVLEKVALPPGVPLHKDEPEPAQ